jgi:ABC-type transporter Mla MlaB component
MLRMTRADTGRVTTIIVEGKILGPWIAEVRAAIAAIPDGQQRRIDVARVTFVDSAGAELLATLQRDGIEVASCSQFIAELMKLAARNLL